LGGIAQAQENNINTMEYLTNTEYNFKKSYKTGDSILNKLKKGKNKKQRKQRLYQNRIPKKYKVYIKSQWWTKRKNKYYKEHKRECILCKCSEHCNLHHLVYGRLGYENDKDLVCLCQSCHEEYHSIYGTQGNMHDNFADFCSSKVNNPII
jgi:hypothetical protein